MAIPTYVGRGTAAAGVAGVTPTIHASTTTNDLMVLFVESNSSQPALAPTDWTEFPDSPQDEGGAGSTCISVFWKRHDGSESDPTVADTGNHTHAVIFSFRGVIATGDPFDVTAGNVANTSTTAVSVPGDTTTVADCLIIGGCTHGTDAAAGTAEFDNTWANTDLSDVTELYDDCTDAGGGGGLGVFSGGKASAGSFGATTATLDTASEQGRWVCALKPAAGGGTAHEMAGSAIGISSATGVLRQGHVLAGSAVGTSSTTGALQQAHVLRGQSVGTSTVTGILRAAWVLAGQAIGVSAASGSLDVPGQEETKRRGSTFPALLLALRRFRHL